MKLDNGDPPMRLRRIALLFINYDGNKDFRTNKTLKTYSRRECDNVAAYRIIRQYGSHICMGQTAGY